MSEFICRRILLCRYYCAVKPRLHFQGFNLFSSAATNSLKPSLVNVNPNSFSFVYVTKTLGFSEKGALKAAKRLKFKSANKPDSVIAFLKSHGLNDTQISNLIRNSPNILCCRIKENLLPKIEFLKSLGFSSSELVKILASGRHILIGGLKTQIIPSFNFLQNFFSSNDDLMYCIKRFPSVLATNAPCKLVANIEILRKAGLPESNILYMLRLNPRAMIVQPQTFGEAVAAVEKIGFDPVALNFVRGLWVLRNSKLRWNEKMEVYKRQGWSEDDVLATFRKYPYFMTISVNKIMRLLDFFIDEIGCNSSILMRRPQLGTCSLEKSTFPRAAVYKVLQSKGLMQKSSLTTLLSCTKKLFLKRYIKRYEQEAPELLKLYHEKSGVPMSGLRK